MPRPATSRKQQPADPDLVDRIFEFLADDPRLPRMDARVLAEVKTDLRHEFRGERVWISGNREATQQRQENAAAVLRLFNGRNATEVARCLGIGRATVYRYLKQQGRPPGTKMFRVEPADRLTFAGRETDDPDTVG